MKLFFSVVFTYVIVAKGSTAPIELSFNKSYLEASNIREILTRDMGIPDDLIHEIIKESPCTPISSALLHICMDDNGDIDFPVVKKNILNHSFRVFKKDLGGAL